MLQLLMALSPHTVALQKSLTKKYSGTLFIWPPTGQHEKSGCINGVATKI